MNDNNEGKSKVAELVINCYGKKYVAFYENEVIGVTLERAYIGDKNKEIKQKLKNDGVGFFKRIGKCDEYWDNFGEELAYMSSYQITDEFKKAVAINYTDIHKYMLQYEKDGDIRDGDVVDRDGEIVIKSKGSKIVFDHRYKMDSPEYIQMIDILEKKAVNAKADVRK